MSRAARILNALPSVLLRSPVHRLMSGRCALGRTLAGTARVVTDHQQAAQALRALVDAVPGSWRPAGLHRSGGRVADQELLRAVTTGGRRAIEVTVGAAR